MKGPSRKVEHRDLPVSDALVEARIRLKAKWGFGKWPREVVISRSRSTAYHEAGHALASCFLYGILPGSGVEIVIEPNEYRDGVTHFGGFRPLLAGAALEKGEHAAFLRDVGVEAYAGIAAQSPEFDPLNAARIAWIDLSRPIDEDDLSEDDPFYEIWESSRADREFIASTADEFGLKRPADRWHMASWNRARRLIDAHWSAVEAVAAALLQSEDGFLFGKEVGRIIEEVGGKSLPAPRWSIPEEPESEVEGRRERLAQFVSLASQYAAAKKLTRLPMKSDGTVNSGDVYKWLHMVYRHADKHPRAKGSAGLRKVGEEFATRFPPWREGDLEAAL